MCSAIDPRGQTGFVGLSLEAKTQLDERKSILIDDCDPLREETLYNLAQDFSAAWLRSEERTQFYYDKY